MIYLPDTNVCVAYLRQRNVAVLQRFAQQSSDDIALCDIVKAELYYGVQRSAQPDRHIVALERFFAGFVSLPFDSRAAEVYGRIRRELEVAGTPIGPYDLQIAAIALANNLTVVTHNTREFRRVNGLRIEDWEV